GGLGGLGWSFPEAAAVGVAFGGFLVLFGFADAGGAFGLGFRLGVALLDRGIFGGSFRLGPRELRQGCSCGAGEGSCGCADVHDLRLRGGIEGRGLVMSKDRFFLACSSGQWAVGSGQWAVGSKGLLF